jgi:ketosteroid isomerase-like protein
MRSAAAALLVCAALATPAHAQSRSTAQDEQAVRAQSERWMQARNAPQVKGDSGTSTREMWIPGAVFVSGNFTHPRFVGHTTPGDKVRTRVQAEKRKNEKLTRQNIRRVTVSEAGDMAWEYTDFEFEYDAASTGKHVTFNGSMLRVWQKENGQWKIAAQFARPNGNE